MERLHQVPEVAVEITEHRHRTPRLLFRLSVEFDAFRYHGSMITSEVIGVQEEEDASTTLVPDRCHLLR